MRLQILMTLLTTLLFSQIGFATLLEVSGHTATISNSEPKVTIQLVGTGLRQKKVLMMNFDVYDATLFASDKTKLSKTDILNSFENQNAFAMQLKFLREVESEKIVAAFKEALKANNVSTESGIMADYLSAVAKGGAATKGSTMTFSGYTKGDALVLGYESPSGKLTELKADKNSFKSVLSMWLGSPVDEQLEKLKESLLKSL